MPKRLGHDLDVEAWFRQGSNFYIGFLKLRHEMQLMLQFIVLCALATEIYLKVVKAIEGRERPLRTHKLWDLFDDLSPRSKEAMEAHWFMIYHEELNRQYMLEQRAPEIAGLFPRRTLENALREAQDAFEAFRYGPGDPSVPDVTGFAAFALPDILLSWIMELRPDLLPLQEKLFATVTKAG